MRKTLSEEAHRFARLNPTLIGSVLGHYFYEHPVHGDESPLVMIKPNGDLLVSDWYELPTLTEMLDYLNQDR